MTEASPPGTAPILCSHLLRRVDEELLTLLAGLEPADWDRPAAGRWHVRDVAAHLLDTALRKLTLARDAHFVEIPAINSPSDFVAFINRINQEGVTVYRRLSPPLLIDLMSIACNESADFHEALDPYAPAAFPVSWAGQSESPNWFDTARELTERWHHQQQIRDATGRPGCMDPEIVHPVLDCFLRGLPHHYRDTYANAGTTLAITITGNGGGRWFLTRGPSAWQFTADPGSGYAAAISLSEQLAWRLFTKGGSREEAAIDGDRPLAEKLLELTAIVG